ncbi:MAG: septal ring lytic transglycosylase RlpA family protein [Rubrobacteraceae bacterium]
MLSTVVRDPVSKIKVTLGAVLLALLLSVVVSERAEAEPMVASYYGNELAGNPTASGVPFDPYGYTAAHKTLPFGTQLEVCLQGCVTVTVNDRGPFVGGRDLDLSLGAAQAIGLTGAGVATVDVTVLGSGGETAAPAEEPAAEPVEEATPAPVEPAPAPAASAQPAVNSESGFVPEVSVALDGTESAEEIAYAYANAYADAYLDATGNSVEATANTTVTNGSSYTEVQLVNI